MRDARGLGTVLKVESLHGVVGPIVLALEKNLGLKVSQKYSHKFNGFGNI